MLWNKIFLLCSCITTAFSTNVDLSKVAMHLSTLSPSERLEFVNKYGPELRRASNSQQQIPQDVNSLWNNVVNTQNLPQQQNIQLQPQIQPHFIADTPQRSSITNSSGNIKFPKDESTSLSSVTRVNAPATLPISDSGQPGALNGNNAMEKFHTSLFQYIGPAHAQQNVIYSPLSIHTLLAFIFTGAEGQTAQEMQTALHLSNNIDETAKLFRVAVNPLHNLGEARLVMANKMYYNQALQTNEQINTAARVFFNAEIDATNFNAPAQSAAEINKWVNEKTQGHITNIVTEQTLSEATNAILVNAIYFKAKWANEFSTSDTQLQQFYMSREHYVAVNMMYNEDTFRYAEFADLQAKVIELPYKDSELSMLIILPNEINGLAQMEQRLATIDLGSIAARLTPELVTLRVPRFRIEFDVDMLQPLKSLGITKLFSSQSELTGFFGKKQPSFISKVQHKAYIEVNEAGSEAAAASYAKLIPLSLPPKQVYFTADHPFMFAIRSPQAVYFVGHVAKF